MRSVKGPHPGGDQQRESPVDALGGSLVARCGGGWMCGAVVDQSQPFDDGAWGAWARRTTSTADPTPPQPASSHRATLHRSVDSPGPLEWRCAPGCSLVWPLIGRRVMTLPPAKRLFFLDLRCRNGTLPVRISENGHQLSIQRV